jgi:succinoglycan biosynthesis protein ExoM
MKELEPMTWAEPQNHQPDRVSEAPLVAVCVPTFKRPQFLEHLLQSLTELERDHFAMDVIVVDNDANGSAESVVQRFIAALPSVIYEVEPERGIAAARNRLVAIATRLGANYLAFVDDDEWVEPMWLSNLVRTAQAYQAEGVAGAVLPDFDPEVPSWIVEGQFFDRIRHPTGASVLGNFIGTCNLLLKRECLDGIEGPFDRAFDLTGGSDRHLLDRLASRGARVVWCDEADVHEHIPTSRGNPWWILKRHFRGGITVSQSARKLEPATTRAARASRTFLNFIRGIVMVPGSVVRGKATTLHTLRGCAMDLGRLVGAVGYTYQEYKNTHGR